MASYVVMQPAEDRQGEAAVFVRDSFRPLAVIIPVLWLMWHRLWFEAVMVLLADFTLVAAGARYGFADWAGLVCLLIGFYVALEGSTLRISALLRRGFAEQAIVDARSLSEAEERYYLLHLPPAPPAATERAPVWGHGGRPSPGAGLFALPGAH